MTQQRVKLKRLETRAVRGLRDLEVPFDGKSLLLWGENGSGKSSLVDSLEFLFTGKIMHLAGTRGLSLEKHAPHLHLGPSAMEVTATFDPGAISIKRSLSNPPAVPPILDPVCDTAKAGNFILRRSQLLEFIHADPSDRFRAIAALIGLEALDDIELAMMRIRDRFEGLRKAQEQEVGRINERLGRLIGAAKASPAAVMEGLNTEASRLGLARLSSLKDIPNKMQEWLRSAKQIDQSLISAISSAKTAAESAAIPTDLANRLVDYQKAFANLVAERHTIDRLAEVTLLEEGQKILENRNPDVCPLCEQPIDVGSALDRIRERRRVLHELSAEFGTFRKLCEEQSSSMSSLARRIQSLGQALTQELDADSAKRRQVLQIAAGFETCSQLIKASTSLQKSCDVDAPLKAISTFECVRKKILEDATSLQQSLALTDRDKAILELFQKANILDLQSRELAEQTAKLTRIVESERRARYVFDTFSTCKKAEITRIYQTIESDVRTFYELLHPGEQHEDFQLVLSVGKRASTELRIKAFGGEHVDPRALTSEGHLDSLGLCIFLAFVKHFTSSWRFLVLDDVILSIDSSHRSRFASLLLTEFSDWQLVITTHDEIWFEEFVKHQRAHRVESSFLNQRIHRWSLEEGPVFHPHRPRWERIVDKLSTADKTGAANDGRQLLEWVLTEICVNTEAQVILRRDGRYTVDNLLVPARKRLAGLLPSAKTTVDQMFQEIEAASTPGNLLSHSNANALALSMDEIKRFCESIKTLYDWFVCPSCNQSPSYVRQIQRLRCCNSRCSAPLEWATS